MTVAARLRKLEAQATPGPWQWLRVGSKEGAHICAESGGAAVVEEMESEGPDWERTDANAAVIVTARNLLPLLADLAEAAEGITDDPEFHEPGPLTIMKGQKARLAAALAHLAAELGGQNA